jgi:hypothetical protein
MNRLSYAEIEFLLTFLKGSRSTFQEKGEWELLEKLDGIIDKLERLSGI